MFEGHKHIITHWYLEINGERVRYRRKRDAVRNGKIVKRINPTTKLLKTQTFFFGKVKSEMKKIGYQEYDRTFLITNLNPH